LKTNDLATLIETQKLHWTRFFAPKNGLKILPLKFFFYEKRAKIFAVPTYIIGAQEEKDRAKDL
jgi:hypothetical protein